MKTTVNSIFRCAPVALWLGAAMSFAQTYERPAEIKAIAEERKRLVGEKDREIAAREQAYAESRRQAESRKGDLPAAIASGRDRVRMFSALIDREEVEIQILRNMATTAEGLAAQMTARGLDEQLTRQIEAAQRQLEESRQRIRALQAEADGNSEAKQRLGDAVTAAEELQMGLSTLLQARQSEDHSVGERQERARRLMETASSARDRIGYHRGRIFEAQGDMAGTMVGVRGNTEELEARKVIDGVRGATRAPEADVLRRYLPTPANRPAGSVEDRARRLLDGPAAPAQGAGPAVRGTHD